MRRNKQSTAGKTTKKTTQATPNPTRRGWDQMNRKQRR